MQKKQEEQSQKRKRLYVNESADIHILSQNTVSQRVRVKTVQSKKTKNNKKMHTKNDAKKTLQMKPFSGAIF